MVAWLEHAMISSRQGLKMGIQTLAVKFSSGMSAYF
jgi:hypothetical protein